MFFCLEIVFLIFFLFNNYLAILVKYLGGILINVYRNYDNLLWVSCLVTHMFRA
jgi:hypothetical protein